MIVIEGGAQRRVSVPPPGGPRKPLEGSPCNGCGVCCTATPCSLIRHLMPELDENRSCPALEREDGRYWCGIMRLPVVGAVFKAALGDGTCDTGPGDGGFEDLYGLTARRFVARYMGPQQ